MALHRRHGHDLVEVGQPGQALELGKLLGAGIGVDLVQHRDRGGVDVGDEPGDVPVALTDALETVDEQHDDVDRRQRRARDVVEP